MGLIMTITDWDFPALSYFMNPMISTRTRSDRHSAATPRHATPGHAGRVRARAHGLTSFTMRSTTIAYWRAVHAMP
jgi:hypothetical protein